MGLEPTKRAVREAKNLLDARWILRNLVGQGQLQLPPWDAHLNLVVLVRNDGWRKAPGLPLVA